MGFKVENIIPCGLSTGSAPAIFMSQNQNVKAVFIISGFSSCVDMANDDNEEIDGDYFNNYEKIKNV